MAGTTSHTWRSEEHTSELQSLTNLVCRLLLDSPTPPLHTLSLHDALPISPRCPTTISSSRYFGIVCIASPVGVRPLDVVRLNAPLTQCSGEITNVQGTFGRHGRNDLAYVEIGRAHV